MSLSSTFNHGYLLPHQVFNVLGQFHNVSDEYISEDCSFDFSRSTGTNSLNSFHKVEFLRHLSDPGVLRRWSPMEIHLFPSAQDGDWIALKQVSEL